MRIEDWELSINTERQEMERTAIGCLSSLGCCLRNFIRRGSSTQEHTENMRERGCQALISVEGDATNIVPVRAHVSLKVPFCGCWPCLGRSRRLATFHFEDNESSATHTSHTGQFDVRRLLQCSTKVSTSQSHIKVCVVTQRDTLVTRIGLDLFLDELRQSRNDVCYCLKVREGTIKLKLLWHEDTDISGDDRQESRDLSLTERMSLQEGKEEGTDTINDTDNRDECDQPLTQDAVEAEDVDVCSQDTTEVTPSHEASQEGHEEAEIWVHRSIHVAPRFRNRLAGPDECFLEYLRCHYSVLVYLEDARKKLHVKGVKKNAEECNLLVRDLLAKWRQDEAEHMNRTDPSLFKLVH